MAATLAELLLARADDDHPALLFEDSSYTWREVVAAGAARADLLTRLRRPGPFHAGVLLENSPEFIFVIVGAAFAGAAVVGINPTRRGGALAAGIRHTDCQLLLTEAEQRPLLDGLDVGMPDDRILLVDSPSYQAKLAPAPVPTRDRLRVAAEDRLLLMFTSGSTGAPKAVVCTQGRLARIAKTAGGNFGLTRDDVQYQSMPLFHGNAIMANWLPSVYTGATMALRRKFSASGFLPDVRRYGATYFNYVGRALAYILATPPTADDADNRLRLGFGTEASARDMSAFRERFGCRVVENYGSSEGVITIQRAPGTPRDALGLPPDVPTMDVIVADPGTGQECPRAVFDEHGALTNADAAIGEIVNRAGAPAFEGYYNNPEGERSRVHADGWYWSGDLGYRDEAGFFYFAGRSNDWLRVDSENFAAAPIERILHRYAGVVMAAVYPVPDARSGDQVMATLELDAGATFDPAAFAGFLGEQADLGTKWAPRYVRIIDAMPLTGNNKVNKQPLRATCWATEDPVFWRPGREPAYRPMSAADRETIRAEFAEFERMHLLGAHGP